MRSLLGRARDRSAPFAWGSPKLNVRQAMRRASSSVELDCWNAPSPHLDCATIDCPIRHDLEGTHSPPSTPETLFQPPSPPILEGHAGRLKACPGRPSANHDRQLHCRESVIHSDGGRAWQFDGSSEARLERAHSSSQRTVGKRTASSHHGRRISMSRSQSSTPKARQSRTRPGIPKRCGEPPLPPAVACQGDSEVMEPSYPSPTEEQLSDGEGHRSSYLGEQSHNSVCPRQYIACSEYQTIGNASPRMQGTGPSKATSKPRKRPRKADDEEDPGLYERTAERQGPRGADDAETVLSQRRLACPFYKSDAMRHGGCLKYRLHRIKDVKQHLLRKHSQSNRVCERCGAECHGAGDWNAHVLEHGCEDQHNQDLDGISLEQRAVLSQRVSRGSSVESQWYEIWHLIFGDRPRPTSVFVGSQIEEALSMVRGVWVSQGRQILADVLDDPGLSAAPRGASDGEGSLREFHEQSLSQLMDSVLSRLQLESDTTARRESRDTAALSTPGAAGGGPMPPDPSQEFDVFHLVPESRPAVDLWDTPPTREYTFAEILALEHFEPSEEWRL